MADTAVVHIGENSPQEVAFKLMHLIAAVENRQAYGHGATPMTREWILKTYVQCRDVVTGFDSVGSILKTYEPPVGQPPR